MSTDADKIAAAIDFEFDAYNPVAKKEMLEKNKRKVDVRALVEDKSEQVVTGKDMQLNVTKGCQEYISRKLHEYLEGAIEFVDTMPEQSKTPAKVEGHKVRLLSSSTCYVKTPIETEVVETEKSGKDDPSNGERKKIKKRKLKTVKSAMKAKQRKLCGEDKIDLGALVVDGFDIINGGADVFKKLINV